MKTARKVMLLVLCAALLVSATVMGTLAYLQDTTETVENTFSIGTISIDLDEAKVDEYGEEVSDERVKANSYKLIPGHEYTKDPTVHVAEGSEVAYVFVKVENGLAGIEAEGNTIEDQIKANDWLALEGLEGVENVFYKAGVDARGAAVDLVVFESFTLADNADLEEDYGQASIKITAYAIQDDGFVDANAAWTAGGFATAE